VKLVLTITGVRLADINGNGKADFIHLDPKEPAATLYMNVGRQPDGSWKWEPWGKMALGVGPPRDRIKFTDMNGDGHADYLAIDNDTGAVEAWYNRGPRSGDWIIPSANNWWNSNYDIGADVASGPGNLAGWTDGGMVAFGDLNGDGRNDYTYIGARSSVTHGCLNACQLSSERSGDPIQ